MGYTISEVHKYCNGFYKFTTVSTTVSTTTPTVPTRFLQSCLTIRLSQGRSHAWGSRSARPLGQHCGPSERSQLHPTRRHSASQEHEEPFQVTAYGSCQGSSEAYYTMTGLRSCLTRAEKVSRASSGTCCSPQFTDSRELQFKDK